MKKLYPVGDDLFLAIAFVVFVVAIITKLLGISEIFWGITPLQLFNTALMCLLFSIALSLRELAKTGEK